MLFKKQIFYITHINKLLPEAEYNKPVALLCKHCSYVNEISNAYCTNCGYPLHNNELVNAYQKKISEKNVLLFKAENAVLFARVVLYIMGAFLSLGMLFIFAESKQKYIIVLLAALLSGLFFFLAFWSQKNPFTALLTAFVVLITFSAANIFGKLVQSFTTVEGFTGMLICLALLLVVLKGVQGAYKINLIKEETQLNV